MTAPTTINDGSHRPPALRCCMNLAAMESMPQFAPLDLTAKLALIQETGYEGVQFGDTISPQALSQCHSLGLLVAQSGRISLPHEADPLVQQFADQGAQAATIHLGWGIEDDNEGSRLIESLLAASAKYRIPLYPETHRATLFQDMWRTVQFVKKFPELRFNADFSHWYTGLEMVYGTLDRKLTLIAPVLEHIGFLHGRIGNPGCIQVDLGHGDETRHPSIAHFRQLWTLAFSGFLSTAASGDLICFAPELLGPEFYYARTFPASTGELQEEGNRWQQSLLLVQLAKACFAQAYALIHDPPSTAPSR